MGKRKGVEESTRQMFQRALDKSDHWIIVHNPWYTNQYRRKPFLSFQDVQEIATWLCILFRCPWGKVHTIQQQTNISCIIAKVEIEIEIGDKFGKYYWVDFLKSPTTYEHGKYSSIFEYDYIRFGDQSENQWKESYPTSSLPPEGCPIVPFPPAPVWSERPVSFQFPINWSIPLDQARFPGYNAENNEVLDASTTVAADEARVLENDEIGRSTLENAVNAEDNQIAVKKEESEDVTVKHEHADWSILLDQAHVPGYNAENNDMLGVSATIATDEARVLENDGIERPPLDSAVKADDQMTVKKEESEDGTFKHEHAEFGCKFDDHIAVKREDDEITCKIEHEVKVKVEDDMASLELCYPDDELEVGSGVVHEIQFIKKEPDDARVSEPSTQVLLVKNPFGVRRIFGSLLPDVSDTWEWVEQFVEDPVALHIDTSQKQDTILISLPKARDLHGILGRHLWREMLKNCPLQWKDEVSTVVRCGEQEFQGRVQLNKPASRTTRGLFCNRYPTPLPFIHEHEVTSRQAGSLKVEQFDEPPEWL